MIYSRASQLALQTMFLLASFPTERSCRVRDIAETLQVSPNYLAKVLHYLTRVGLLRSARGPRGGLRLGRPAQDITLWDVLVAIESVNAFDRCVLGLGHCNDQHSCPVHAEWKPIRAQILAMMQGKSLGEFARQAKEEGLMQDVLRGSGPEPHPPACSPATSSPQLLPQNETRKGEPR